MISLSGLYNNIKICVMVMSIILSIGILSYGICIITIPVTGDTSRIILIVVGIIWLITSIFNFVDYTRVSYKIKQEIDCLETNIKQYEEEIVKFKCIIDNIHKDKKNLDICKVNDDVRINITQIHEYGNDFGSSDDDDTYNSKEEEDEPLLKKYSDI